MVQITENDILKFWFKEISSKNWFNSTKYLDLEITQRFKKTVISAKKGELYFWRKTAQGRLAEIIVLDQFSRNIYRNDKKAYEGDLMALTLAQEGVMHHNLNSLTLEERSFFYMPFMHSESLEIQKDFSLHYFREKGLGKRLIYAKEHYETIKRFGRFPYRNKVLGRKSTAGELEYLIDKGY